MLGVGIIRMLFLAFEELMILRKRQSGKQHFPLPIAKMRAEIRTKCRVGREAVLRARATHKEMPRHPGTEQAEDQRLKINFVPFCIFSVNSFF